ncbi:MAG: glucose-6-phosphate isomerase [Pseudomonadota bacterium]
MSERSVDWPPYFSGLYIHRELELAIDLSLAQISPALEAELTPRFAAAFAQMHALESGAIANPDERRMVGHFWLRAPELAPNGELAESIRNTREAVTTFARGVLDQTIRPERHERFTDLLCIGIGGSALGPQLLVEALAAATEMGGLRTHFIDNTDPEGIDRVVAPLLPRLGTTLVVVTSKSGGTPETRNGMLEVAHVFESHDLEMGPQAIAITGRGSKLDATAREENWLARFYMEDWVGGRTSLFSAVGLVPAALAGIDTGAMARGAAVMDEATRVANLAENPAARLALGWYAAGEGVGQRDMVMLPYKDSLLLFSRYLQQLVMESLGKGTDLDGKAVKQGIAVYGNKGSTDQHAYVQQLREGLDNFFVTFVEVLRGRDGGSVTVEHDTSSADYLSGFLHGTRQALAENGRRSITITVPVVDARRLGALIALYERTVGLYAHLVNINAYHQPGVEAGKRAAGERLQLQHAVLAALRDADGHALGLDALAASAGSDDLIAVFQTVRHLDANRPEVRLSGDPRKPEGLRVQLTA